MPVNGKVQMCVVGLGMGYHHARSYDKMKDKVDLYVCDMDEKRLQRAKDELDNIRGTFSSLEEAFEADEIEAFDTSLPHYMHKDAILKAAEIGKHFMTEKPIARNLAEADEMIKAAKDDGIIFMVAENQRFLPTAVKARELIDQGMLGKVFLVRVYEMWLSRVGGWRNSLERAGGGNLIDSGIHAIDTLRMLGASDIEFVFSQTRGEVLTELEAEDTALVQVKFKNGAMGDLITSWGIKYAGPRPILRFAVYGTEGCLWDADGLYVQSDKFSEYRVKPTLVEIEKADTIALECAHFVDCILNGKQPIMSGEEGRKDLEVVMAAYRSAETGQPVKLPLIS